MDGCILKLSAQLDTRQGQRESTIYLWNPKSKSARNYITIY